MQFEFLCYCGTQVREIFFQSSWAFYASDPLIPIDPPTVVKYPLPHPQQNIQFRRRRGGGGRKKGRANNVSAMQYPGILCARQSTIICASLACQRVEEFSHGGGAWAGRSNNLCSVSSFGHICFSYYLHSDINVLPCRYTANKRPVSIQYKCLVPIYEFPKMKLLFPQQN
jgi:hypothetical protein